MLYLKKSSKKIVKKTILLIIKKVLKGFYMPKKSKKQLQKEASDDIEKCLKEVLQEKEAKELTDKIIKDVEENFKKEKEKVQKMSPQLLAYWLISKHKDYIETMKVVLNCDFLNERDKDSRYYLLTYIVELYNMLSQYELDFFNKDVTKILEKENETELLSILNCLNYI